MTEMPNFPTMIGYITEHGRLRSFRKGQMICFQGDQLNDVYMVKTGVVKIYNLTRLGDEQTISLFDQNCFFPLSWLVRQPDNRIVYNYEALTDVECYTMSVDKLHDFLVTCPNTMSRLLDVMGRAYINHSARIINLQRTSIKERLDFVLYYLANRLGHKTTGVVCLPVKLTHSDIASLAGVTRESISRQLGVAKKDKLLWTAHGKTYIDVNQIKSDEFAEMVM